MAYLVKDPLVALGVACMPALLPASSKLRDHPVLRRLLILLFDEAYDGGVAVGRGEGGIAVSKRRRTATEAARATAGAARSTAARSTARATAFHESL